MSYRKVIGLRSAFEALKVRDEKELKEIYLRPDFQKNSDLKKLALMAEKKGLRIKEMSLKKLDKVAPFHQGVLVVVDHQFVFDPKSLSQKKPILLLDRIQDPRNLGAIIRSAWLLGAEAVVVSKRNSVSLTALVIKAACGGVEHVVLHWEDNLSSLIQTLKKNQFWIYDLDAGAEKNIFQQDLKGPVAFLLGGEGEGARKSNKKACDAGFFIPQKDQEASLNVSVAASVVLAESLRQNGG